MNPARIGRVLTNRIAWMQAKIDLGVVSPPAIKSMSEEKTAMRCALEMLGVFDQSTLDAKTEQARRDLLKQRSST